MHVQRNRRDSALGIIFFAAILLAVGMTAAKFADHADPSVPATQLFTAGS